VTDASNSSAALPTSAAGTVKANSPCEPTEVSIKRVRAAICARHAASSLHRHRMTRVPGSQATRRRGPGRRQLPLTVSPGGGVGEITAQPSSALPTAAMSSLMDTAGPPSGFMAGQRVNGTRPRAMFTPVISSSIVTTPSPSQSPVHCAGASRGQRIDIDTPIASSVMRIQRRGWCGGGSLIGGAARPSRCSMRRALDMFCVLRGSRIVRAVRHLLQGPFQRRVGRALTWPRQ
jgi:hypothetical protein